MATESSKAALSYILDDTLPREEPLDYITDFDERCDMFDEWHRMQQKYGGSMTPAAVGIAMIAPLDRLRAFTEELHTQDHGEFSMSTVPGLLDNLCLRSADALSICMAKASNFYFQPEKEKGCSGVCVVTGTPEAESARVFPYSKTCACRRSPIETTLRMFWGEERAALWISNFSDNAFMKSPKNTMFLDTELHWWFVNAKVAFKPLPGDDPHTIELQLHWLKDSTFQDFKKPIDEDVDFVIQAGLDGTQGRKTWGHRVYSTKSGQPIETGQIYRLWAENTDELPSRDMLELQWDLLRVAAIAGADGDDDEFAVEDSDVEPLQLDQEKQ
ncbi:hypothetical protein FALBO_12732 [Fusarium albosuccineum]|uniref:HNH nuclease domain-containing protein n=1 Tax=Fusarium albosuccineum TaxID=1237068 RepID=A0A8H4P2V1_9HYPO|nr:hypothetical protein FALBO_12732 [Fusarium albosuccineum]